MVLRKTCGRLPRHGRHDVHFQFADARLRLRQGRQLRAAPADRQRRKHRIPLLRPARAGRVRRRFPDPLQRRRGRRIARLRQETLSAGGGRRRPGDLGQSADDQPRIRLPKPARRLRILLAGIRFGNSDLLGRRRRLDLPPRPRDAERHLSHEGDGRIRSPHRRDSGRKNVGNRSLGLSDRRRREGLPLRILDRHAHRAGNALPRTIRPAGTVRLENRRSARHPHVLRGRNHRIPQFEDRGIRRTRRV